GLRFGRVLNPRLDAYGYRIVELHKGRPHKPLTRRVHRLVALAFFGPAPEDLPEVDHINRNRSDNRAVNLRWSSVPDNRFPAVCKSRSGQFGVRYRADKDRWQAYATVDRKFKSLGHFLTAQEAADARKQFDAERAVRGPR